MRRRRLLVPGLALAICLLCLLASSCCLTNRMWAAVADQPGALQGASLTEDRVLHLAVRYEDGRSWRVEAPLTPGEAWTFAKGLRKGPLMGALPGSAFTVVRRHGVDPGPGEVDVWYNPARDKQGRTSHTVWVDGGGCLCLVVLPQPVDWTRVTPYLAIVASLFTLLVDLLAAPIWVAWVLFTAGGHGRCWLPWCD